MKIPFTLPFTLHKISRSNTWRIIAFTLIALLGLGIVMDGLVFLRYGLGWSAGVTQQQYDPVVLDADRLNEATRVVQKREDVRATRDYGPLPKNLFQ